MTDKDFVFAHPAGAPLDPSTVTHIFARVVRKAGLELRLHDLRHSFASVMLAAGVDVKVISQSLGHANIGITLDTYAHLLPGMGKAAAERFEKLLKPWLSEENGGKMVAKPDEIGTRLEGFEPTTPGSEVCLPVSLTVLLKLNSVYSVYVLPFVLSVSSPLVPC